MSIACFRAGLVVLLLAGGLRAEVFEAGAARADITPPPGLPMWGYGARKDIPATGTLDPLLACAVVIRAGEEKIAIVGLDIGRSPARETMKALREDVAKEHGIRHIILVGSHTHHGPCIEIESAPPTAEYVRTLRGKLAGVIGEAARALRPARIGVAGEDLKLNRNRHSKIEPKPVDRRLTVVRLDDLEGKTIAVLVNFAAHPTTRDATMLQWSSDYCGALRARVEEELGGICVFLQGACGDLSPSRDGLGTDEYGRKVGGEAARLAKSTAPSAPPQPSLTVREEELRFSARVDLNDTTTYLKYCIAFFKDLVDTYRVEYKEGIRPALTVAILNGDIGIAAVSGEFFSSHAIRLRERSRLPHLLFLGYANGYHQYFPTIEAAAEGGYGADPEVAPAEVGAGERVMDRALFHLHDMRKKIR
jgi:neutral ceramidase